MQEFEFWDMWKKSQKSTMDTDGSTAANTEAPAKEDESQPHPDAPPAKYPKPSSKGGGQTGGRGKGTEMGARASPGMTNPSGNGRAQEGLLGAAS